MTEPFVNKTSSEQEELDDDDDDDDDSLKIFVSRVPTQLNEASLQTLIEEHTGLGSVRSVNLVYNHHTDPPSENPTNLLTHRGFGFITMFSLEAHRLALEKKCLRVTLSNKRKRTLYLRSLVREENDEDSKKDFINKSMCFLWTENKCPYGDTCKFEHSGPGGCKLLSSSTDPTTKRGKCFSFKKTGKCKLGEACPFRHVQAVENDSSKPKRKRQVSNDTPSTDMDKKVKRNKVPQPLSVRVFGLNYDTTEADVKEFFEPCGKIREISFPVFEDSGRSKGYCGVWFTSPKAVQKACEELDGKELQGRWLRVQAGKMFIRQWETMEKARKETKKHLEK